MARDLARALRALIGGVLEIGAIGLFIAGCALPFSGARASGSLIAGRQSADIDAVFIAGLLMLAVVIVGPFALWACRPKKAGDDAFLDHPDIAELMRRTAERDEQRNAERARKTRAAGDTAHVLFPVGTLAFAAAVAIWNWPL